MFQEKNVKSLYKIKNVYIYQWLKKMLIYDIYLFYCIYDTKSSDFRHFITTYGVCDYTNNEAFFSIKILFYML